MKIYTLSRPDAIHRSAPEESLVFRLLAPQADDERELAWRLVFHGESLSVSPRLGAVELVVSDTGVGVNPEFREAIFTKFYQPGDLGKHSTSKSRFKGGGAGLGLALSRGIVEAHGGRIWVESPGHDETNFPGSQFHVMLPLAQPEEGRSLPMGQPVNITIGEKEIAGGR